MSLNSMTPQIREMLDAANDRARADVLLRCPDAVLIKHAEIFTRCCERASFQTGKLFVAARVAAMHAVRNRQGTLPEPLRSSAARIHAEVAIFASGYHVGKEQKAEMEAQAATEWPLDAPQPASDEPAGFRR